MLRAALAAASATLVSLALTAGGAVAAPAGPTDLQAAGASAGAKGDVATAEPRLVSDPNTLWVGTADEGSYTSTWGQSGAGQTANTSQTAAPAGGHGKAIRIANAGGGTSGDRWGYDGRFGFKEMGIATQEEAYLRYYVYFPADYEFDTQGKLPGLQGVTPGGSPWLANNSITCTSGTYKGKDCHDDRQFGARTMWKNGGMISYLNVVSIGGKDRDAMRTSSGDNYSFSMRYLTAAGTDMKFKAGWNYVEQHVKLNTPGQENGVFEGWINGQRGLSLTNVQYRTSAYASMQISQWNLAHFWGGPTSDYPQRATQVFYDDIVVSKAPIGARGGSPAAPSGKDVSAFGDAKFHGSTGALALNAPLISVAPTKTGGGYWLLARDGGVFSYGDATFHGSTGGKRLNQPIVSLAGDPKGRGYWFVAADGGVFAFGAPFGGSMGGRPLNQPIVGMAPTTTGDGYWLVARDGGIFSFGDAKFMGSTGAKRLNQPIVAMVANPAGKGYWFVAADGGVFAFGAPFLGSAAGQLAAGDRVVGMAASAKGGYWLVSEQGRVFSFGGAALSSNGAGDGRPVVGVAPTPSGTGYWLAMGR